jgi:hypothetical protein
MLYSVCIYIGFTKAPLSCYMNILSTTMHEYTSPCPYGLIYAAMCTHRDAQMHTFYNIYSMELRMHTDFKHGLFYNLKCMLSYTLVYICTAINLYAARCILV